MRVRSCAYVDVWDSSLLTLSVAATIVGALSAPPGQTGTTPIQ